MQDVVETEYPLQAEFGYETVQNTSELEGKKLVDVLGRIKTFLDHFCLDDHIDHEAHTSTIAPLEKPSTLAGCLHVYIDFHFDRDVKD